MQPNEQNLSKRISERFGSIAIAAAYLGIGRTTLFKWMADGWPKNKEHLLDKLLS